TPVAGATVTVTDVRSTTSASFPVITGTGPLVLTKTTATTSRTVTYTGTPTGRDDDFVDGSQSTVPLVVFGGEGNDTIVGGSANDILVGDRGTIDFVDNPGAVQFAVAPNDETPNIDSSLGTIEAIRGGGGGGGDETISWIPSSFVVQSTYAGDNQDGKDTLVGNGGSDILIGGLNDDFEYGDAAPATLLASLAAAGHVLDKAFTPGASDNDVLVGDDGAVLAPNGTPSAVTSTEPQVGGHDTLDGADGSDVVIGGGNSDTITASLGGDIILGDSGFVDLHGNVESIAPETGGDDTILAGSGTDTGDRSILIGGAGNDTIVGGNGPNIILGDSGEVFRTSDLVVHEVLSLDPSVGGVDHITSGTGDDVILGGAAGDCIQGTSGNDVILGDNGDVFLNNTASGNTNDIKSIALADGGDDSISTGAAGLAIVIGGAGVDHITTGTGNAVILGDNGEVDSDNNEVILTVETTDVDASTAAGDIIDSNISQGTNVILGGVGSDHIMAGGGSQNIILGDDGVVNLNHDAAGDTNDIYSDVTGPGATGDVDYITAGSNNVIIGGYGADQITLGGGFSVVLGDNGEVDRGPRTGLGTLSDVIRGATTDTTEGTG